VRIEQIGKLERVRRIHMGRLSTDDVTDAACDVVVYRTTDGIEMTAMPVTLTRDEAASLGRWLLRAAIAIPEPEAVHLCGVCKATAHTLIAEGRGDPSCLGCALLDDHRKKEQDHG
jgi:hypothetical protein